MNAWKAGDVALVKCSDGKERIAIAADTSWDSREWVFGSNGRRGMQSEARPLVVIDPESADDVGRLNVLIAKSGHHRGRLDLLREHTALAAALREFAAPIPPRPDEPTGLGAVVEDKLGRAWVRGPNGWTNLNATGRYLNWKHWDDADDPLSAAVVRILSPGVEVES